MALSDTKKVQSFINLVGNEIQSMRDSAIQIEQIYALFSAANPNVTGTPLQGNVQTLITAYANLKTQLDNPVWTALINARVPSHEGKALNG